MNADERFDSFNSTLVSITNDTFPYVTRKTKPLDISKPYIYAELRELIKRKNYFVIICNTYGENFSDGLACEGFMSSADVGETFEFSTANLEALEMTINSLKNLSPDPSFHSKRVISFSGPVKLQMDNKYLN